MQLIKNLPNTTQTHLCVPHQPKIPIQPLPQFWPKVPSLLLLLLHSIGSCAGTGGGGRLSRVLGAFARPSSRSAGARRGGICCPVNPIVEPPPLAAPLRSTCPRVRRAAGVVPACIARFDGGPHGRVTDPGEPALLPLLTLLLPLPLPLLLLAADSCGKQLCFVLSAVKARNTYFLFLVVGPENNKDRLP